MYFLHTGLAIAGLAGISVPIIIHLLFRNRRKPIEWGAMRFLLEAYRKMRRRMQIEHFLLLAVRCLIICVLGLALARPLLSGSDIGFLQGGRLVYILIDNGAAAAVEDESGVSSLARHKRRARGIVDALGQSDKVSVVSIARPVEVLIHSPVLDHSGVKKVINDIGQYDSPTDIPDGLKRVSEVIQSVRNRGESERVLVYLLSDFLLGSVDVEGSGRLPANLFSGDIAADGENNNIMLAASLPMEGSPGNVQITSIEPLRLIGLPNSNDGAGQFRVRLRRTGDSVLEAGLSAVRVGVDSGGGVIRGRDARATGFDKAAGFEGGKAGGGFLRTALPVVVQWDAGQAEATVNIGLDMGNILKGSHVITVSIDRDLLPLDNSRSVIFEARNSLTVAIVARREFSNTGAVEVFPGSAWIRRALNPDNGNSSQIEIIDIDPSSINRNTLLRGVDAVVVTRPDVVTEGGWQILREFVNQSGLLWLMPAGDSDVQLWTDYAVEVLGLPWRIGRAVEVYGFYNDSGDEAVDTDGFTGSGSWKLAGNQPESELFSMIRAELTNLVRSTEVYKRVPVVADPGGGVLLYEDGSMFMVMGRPGSRVNGSGGDSDSVGVGGVVLYLSSVPRLDWTTLPSKPFMVALVQEIIRQGVGISSTPQVMAAGDQPYLDVPASANFLVLSDEVNKKYNKRSNRNDSGVNVDPGGNDTQIALVTDNEVMAAVSGQKKPVLPVTGAGVYNIISNTNQRIGQLVVNVDPSSTVTESQDKGIIKNWLDSGGGGGGSSVAGGGISWRFMDDGDDDRGGGGSDDGKGAGDGNLLSGLDDGLSAADLSGPLFILLLALVIIETLLSRWFSHADRVQAERGLSNSINPVAVNVISAPGVKQAEVKDRLESGS